VTIGRGGRGWPRTARARALRTTEAVRRRGRPAGTVAMIPAANTEDRTALVGTNPRVKTIAWRLRWSTNTVIRRVRAALPSRIEQQLYLYVGGTFRLQPESLRKLLDVFCDRPLMEGDLVRAEVGKNLVTSRFDETVEKLEIALQILDKTADLFYVQPIAMRRIAILVEAYGAEAEGVIASLVERSQELIERLRLRADISNGEATAVALKILTGRLDRHEYRVLPLTLEEMF
jgi:hypothetical protein